MEERLSDTVNVRTMKKRLRRGLTAIAEWCQENRHEPVDRQQKTLNAKLRGPLPVLRATDELQEHLTVLSGSLQHLAKVAQSPNSREETDVGEICRTPPSISFVAPSDNAFLERGGE